MGVVEDALQRLVAYDKKDVDRTVSVNPEADKDALVSEFEVASMTKEVLKWLWKRESNCF